VRIGWGVQIRITLRVAVGGARVEIVHVEPIVDQTD